MRFYARTTRNTGASFGLLGLVFWGTILIVVIATYAVVIGAVLIALAVFFGIRWLIRRCRAPGPSGSRS
jgi:hypothetical protein